MKTAKEYLKNKGIDTNQTVTYYKNSIGNWIHIDIEKIMIGYAKQKLIMVEECKYWVIKTEGRGHNCYNCMYRNGFPYRGLPDENCKNFEFLEE